MTLRSYRAVLETKDDATTLRMYSVDIVDYGYKHGEYQVFLFCES
jgi:hypothetical protein